MVQCYELPRTVVLPSTRLETWVVGISQVPTYEFREGLRTIQPALVRTIYPIHASRFRFRTDPMKWQDVPSFMSDLLDAFPDEAGLRPIAADIIKKANAQFAHAETCFVIEGPTSKELMLAKLRFAA
jgi:hypothetical protein